MSDNTQVPVETEELDGQVQVDVNGEKLFDLESFEALKGVVLNLSVKLDEIKVKQKDFKQRLNNLFENDMQLLTFEEKAKEVTQSYKKRKQELIESIEGKEIRLKLKELGEEMRDIQDSLTNHLLNYFQVTGSQSFDTPTGEEREFKLSARLLPAKK